MDASLALALHGLATSLPWFGVVVVGLAQAGIFVLPAALLVVWLVASAPDDGQRQGVLAGVVAALVAVGVGLLLERVVNRPRPFVEFGFDPLFGHAQDSSFPSDHTLVGVALVGPMMWRSPRLGVWLLIWALLVGFARVAASVHYPTDIIGSAVLALVVDALVWMATRPVRRRVNLQRWDAARLGTPPGARRP